jgi:hypothetical protein
MQLQDALSRTLQKQEQTMKAISSITLGAALLVTGVAFAQTPAQHDSEGAPPPTATDSSSKNSDIMENNAPANNTPSKATDANGASATSQSASQACEKQATDKKLSGDDKSAWVKKCKMGKTTRQDH